VHWDILSDDENSNSKISFVDNIIFVNANNTLDKLRDNIHLSYESGAKNIKFINKHEN
jgi:hypothetical protein